MLTQKADPFPGAGPFALQIYVPRFENYRSITIRRTISLPAAEKRTK